MSISDAFRNLNQSIRGIRQDREQHEANVRNAELQQAQLEYQMNDPKRQYERQLYEDKVKLVEFDSGIVFNPDDATLDQTFVFNRSLPALQSVVSDYGAELTNKGKAVEAGTSKPLIIPKWKADTLKAQIKVAMAMEQGKEATLNDEIRSLENNITKQEGTLRDVKEPTSKMKLDRGRWENRLAKLKEKRDNPESYAKMLMDDNKSNMASLNALYSMPLQNEKLITMLHNKIKLNNQMLASLSKSGDLKDMVGHTYTLTNRDGTKNEITEYFKKGTPVPPTRRGPGGVYVRGKQGTVGSGKSKNPLDELAKKNRAEAKWTAINAGIAAFKSKIGQKEAIMGLMESDAFEGKSEEFIRKMFDEGTKEQLAILEERRASMMELYKDQPWFSGAIETKYPAGAPNRLNLTPRKKGGDYDSVKKRKTYSSKEPGGRGLLK